MATGNSLVSDTLSRIGRLESGGTATATELADGISELNRMLGMWNAEMGPIFAETLDSLTWTGGQASRTIGVSGNFNVARPQMILSAQYRDSSGYDFDLEIIPHREYQADYMDKAQASEQPMIISYNPTFTSSLGTLFIWPVPPADTTIRLNSRKPIADLTGAGTVVLPPGYEDAIINNLAPRLCQMFGAEITALMMQLANESKTAIVQANIQFPSVSRSARYPQSWPHNQ